MISRDDGSANSRSSIPAISNVSTIDKGFIAVLISSISSWSAIVRVNWFFLGVAVVAITAAMRWTAIGRSLGTIVIAVLTVSIVARSLVNVTISVGWLSSGDATVVRVMTVGSVIAMGLDMANTRGRRSLLTIGLMATSGLVAFIAIAAIGVVSVATSSLVSVGIITALLMAIVISSVVISMVVVTVAATVVILAVFLATRFDKASLFGISRLFLIIATVISLSVMTRIGVGVGVAAISMALAVTVV